MTSGQIAGGFAGKTTFAYLANINLDSELVKGLVTVVNQILKALWLDELQKGQVIKIDLGIIEIDALYDGKLVSLNLLGLDIKVGLAEDKSLATIYIGDSKIEINCSESGTIDEESLKNEINISLIKANRTKIDKCTVTGIADGYDVYGAAPETMPTAQVNTVLPEVSSDGITKAYLRTTTCSLQTLSEVQRI